MASNNPSGIRPCLICMETPDRLKVLRMCKHAFCIKCLTRHVQKLGEASRTFPCPSCKADCPLSDDGIDGLQDYDGVEITEADGTQGPSANVFCGLVGLTKGKTALCQSCSYTKSLETEAESLCEECGYLCLCKDCSLVHGTNKATAAHTVVALKTSDVECCRKHKQLITRFCSSCTVLCCRLCVLLDHGDHTIKGISEVFHELVDEVKNLTLEQAKRPADVRKFESQLGMIQCSEVAQREEVILREIEDHAEVYIAQIIKRKAALKEQVKLSYQVVTQVTECLDKLPAIAKLEETLAKAIDVLSGAEPHPKDIQKLLSVKQAIVEYGIENDINMDNFWDSFDKLLDKPIHFVPKTPDCNLGALEAKERFYKSRLLKDTKLTFEKKLEVDDPAKFVPCVSVIDKEFYAVAHPTLESKVSDGFDIYKFQGIFQQTFKENADSLCDMAATPDGRLAVLGRGSSHEFCCARLFHPVTGFTKSTKDFQIRNPLSFDVSYRHQYVILSNDGGRRVTICNEDGSVDLVHQVNPSNGISDAIKIACSSRYVYVLGRIRLVVYERKNNDLVEVTTSGTIFNRCNLTGISVTKNDQVLLCYDSDNCSRFWFGTFVLTCRTLSQSTQAEAKITNMTKGQNRAMKLSANDSFAVTSLDGSMIRVYTF
ncbi:uncharacterized protein LOC135501997 [Lineus longissimus]|uniref:uncharacterized protein LOC135501997 n=1 Tax=Lineus longissimus TaxID=88925 RepID=UPI002B4DA779